MYEGGLLHTIMYISLYREPVLRPYIRREHRIWPRKKPEGRRKEQMILDFALLDPEKRVDAMPGWPVREMIQLKYPVEYKSGRTEPDDLIIEKAEEKLSYHRKRCRTRITRKIRDDYNLFDDARNKVKDISEGARCHIMFFDLAKHASYSSNDEFREDLRNPPSPRRQKIDPMKIGKWPLTITYVHTRPRYWVNWRHTE